MLTFEQGKRLLALARQSIESYFSKNDIDFSSYSNLSNKQGVFVTLNKKEDLRGCIGFPHPTHELFRAVFDAARAAAFEDPRFPPLKESELDDITIDISVLTVPEEIKAKRPEEYIKNIHIGTDGLIIKGHLGSGLLLPQVFTDNNCTPESALNMVCQKAGLNTKAWKDKENIIFKFQAQIFKE